MKYALITGGTKGIGKAISKALLDNGYHVILNYASDDRAADSVFEEFQNLYPGRVYLIKEDLSKINRIDVFCEQVSSLTNKLDVLILNAGKTDRTMFPDVEYEAMLSVFHTNLFVPFFLIQGLINLMPQGSSIISIGSAMGEHPHSVSVAYGVSKSAAHAMTKNLVKFLSPSGIRINTIAPGFVITDWHHSKSDSLKKNIESKIALHRFCEPEEIADLAMLLISNAYMNGAIIKLDGGYNFE